MAPPTPDSLIERTLKIGAYSGAPLSSNSVLEGLDDLSESDVTPEMFLEEMKLYLKITDGGLRTFLEGFEECSLSKSAANSIQQNSPVPESGVPVLPTGNKVNSMQTHCRVLTYLFPFYMHRVAKLGERLTKMAEMCMKQSGCSEDCPTELVDDLRRLKQMIAKGSRPKHVASDVFDMTEGIEWAIPDVRHASSASNISGAPLQHSGKSIHWNPSVVDASSKERPDSSLSRTGFGRCKQRKPTNYTKFNFSTSWFKDLDLDEDDNNNNSGYGSNGERPSPKLAPTQSGSSNQELVGNTRDSGESVRLRSQHSSFDESPPHIIEDERADPHWQDGDRSQNRQRRIRQRIPTGHPTMARNAVLARMSLDNDCRITKRNTERNAGILDPD